MKILIADDDRVSLTLLERILSNWGYHVETAHNGEDAFSLLQQKDHADIAILDWMMPGLEGPEICRRLRKVLDSQSLYIIILTVLDHRENLLAGFEAGADDYIVKPFDHDILHARIKVGARIVNLQRQLGTQVTELTDALQRVKKLEGLLPICAYCKKIRADENYWQQIEEYLAMHSEAKFSHGICPDCYSKLLDEDEVVEEKRSRKK